MTKRVSRLQQGVGLALLAVGIGIFAFHTIRHPHESGGFDVKAAIGIAAVGLLLLPFEAGPLFAAVLRWRERKTGGDGNPSGGNSA